MTPTLPARLLACPGCGSNDTRVIGGPGTAGGPKHWAGCDHCRWRTWGDTEAEAIAAWNTREAAAALSDGREAVAPQPSDGWRPIAEAPKDGTPMLGLWLPSPGAYYRITGANYGIVAFDDDAQFWVLIDEADMTAEVAAPDLFQLLPAAPSAKGVDRG